MLDEWYFQGGRRVFLVSGEEKAVTEGAPRFGGVRLCWTSILKEDVAHFLRPVERRQLQKVQLTSKD